MDSVSIAVRASVLLFLSALCAAAAAAQSGSRPIYLEGVVAPKSGAPVSGLQQADFTVLDNKVPQKILSFQALGGPQAPINVTIVVDDVNIGMDHLLYERQQVDKFLLAGKGAFEHPITLVIVTDTNTVVENHFSTDRGVLASWLDKSDIPKRVFDRGGVYHDVERLNISLAAFRQLMSLEANLPGRKLVLWVSPGWSLVNSPWVIVDSKQERQIFENITSVTDLMLQGHITLYSIDPLGTTDFGGRSYLWKEWAKPVRRPDDAQFGNLGLEVFATQSGGLALNTSNDIVGLLQQCLADTQAYYEISFEPLAGQKPEELHTLEVRVAKPGLIARTRWDYYTPVPSTAATH